eukprot:9109789-Alexandrium_andersonii.AAC.1
MSTGAPTGDIPAARPVTLSQNPSLSVAPHAINTPAFCGGRVANTGVPHRRHPRGATRDSAREPSRFPRLLT